MTNIDFDWNYFFVYRFVWRMEKLGEYLSDNMYYL